MKLNYLIYYCFLSINITMSQKQRDIEETLPTRQVHLDFHTSEQIPNIGAKFDKKQFQLALIEGKVNQINICLLYTSDAADE